METLTQGNSIELLKEIDSLREINRDYNDLSNEQVELILEYMTPEKDEIPSFDVIVLMYPNERLNKDVMNNDFDAYDNWVDDQLAQGDCYYYSAYKEEYNLREAICSAAILGKHYLIVDNLS